MVEKAGMADDLIDSVWLTVLNHLSPRAYTFTPSWNETANPALQKALETGILNPNADVTAGMKQVALEAPGDVK